MNKSEVFNKLIEQLESELANATKASKDAASYATDSEAKADSKWDTQGLEASYLAAGQAAQAKELIEGIAKMKACFMAAPINPDTASLGCLLKCDLGRMIDWFLLAPSGGGETLDMEGVELTVLTPHSPLGSQLIAKSKGASFLLPNGSTGTILEIS